MSPPAQLEKRIGANSSGCGPKQRSISRTSSGTASNSTRSKKCRLRRTSSSTCGRVRRTSAVCHHSASDSRMPSTSRARAGAPRRSSSSSASRSLTSPACCMIDQRVASVGWAVSVRSSRMSSSARAVALDERVGQPRGRLGDRLALRRPLGALVGAPAADALARLGQVGEVQLHRAGADDVEQVAVQDVRGERRDLLLGARLLGPHARRRVVQPDDRVAQTLRRPEPRSSPPAGRTAAACRDPIRARRERGVRAGR